MRTFVFEVLDRPDTAQLRDSVRPAHRHYIRRPHDDLRCILGGQILDPVSRAVVGTLLIFEADDAEAVRRFMADDPYAKAALFETSTVREWTIGLGAIAASCDTTPP